MMPWFDAMTVAKRIKDAVAAHSERIEIAGSLRRMKPQVKDIDLVAIPRFTSATALFGGAATLAETDFVAELLLDFAEDGKGNSSMDCSGDKLIRFRTRFGALPEISVDCYIATPETWATLLLIRTGSAEHNIWLAQRAKQCGGKLHADGSGLELPGQYDPYTQRTINQRIVRPETEEEIFKALGLPTPAPPLRECRNGQPVWLHGEAA